MHATGADSFDLPGEQIAVSGRAAVDQHESFRGFDHDYIAASGIDDPDTGLLCAQACRQCQRGQREFQDCSA